MFENKVIEIKGHCRSSNALNYPPKTICANPGGKSRVYWSYRCYTELCWEKAKTRRQKEKLRSKRFLIPPSLVPALPVTFVGMQCAWIEYAPKSTLHQNRSKDYLFIYSATKNILETGLCIVCFILPKIAFCDVSRVSNHLFYMVEMDPFWNILARNCLFLRSEKSKIFESFSKKWTTAF